MDAFRAFVERGLAPALGHDRTIAPAEHQPVIGRSARVVIRPPGVPQHHGAKADAASIRRGQRAGGDNVGVEHAEPRVERLEVRRGVSRREDDGIRAATSSSRRTRR